MEGYICIILWEFMSYENYIFWRTTKRDCVCCSDLNFSPD